MKDSSALPLAWVTLRILIVLNWVFGAAILALLIATIVAEQWTFTALGIPPSSWMRPVMTGLRVIGGIGKLISTPAHPLHLDAGFSTNGWLAVILVFVLARVFAQGTLIREELEGTV